MEFYIGNTDLGWFNFLRHKNPEDINFWQPGGKLRFHVLKPGAPFIFRLKSPISKIAGIGFFASHSLLPIDFAWEVFQQRNGVQSLVEFRQKINSFRAQGNSIEIHPIIGCLILTNPVFFNEEDWQPLPPDWQLNLVQGKKYDSAIGHGKILWEKIEFLLHKYKVLENSAENKNQFILEDENLNNRYGTDVLRKVRLGQGAFRIMITDAYTRRCAISGEKTLPVLDAAHIKPFEEEGPHYIANGLLLRTDIHRLFDKGYLTITKDYKIEVSGKIREEFENGRDYYKYHGKDLMIIPSRMIDKPAPQFIDWHNHNVYKG